MPLRVVNGRVMPAPKREPKNAAEMEEWLSNRHGTGGDRLPHRERLPRGRSRFLR